MKKVYSLLIAFTLVFSLTGCMETEEKEPVSPDTDEKEDSKETKEKKVTELNDKALKDIAKEEYQTKEKIKEATEYITNNVNMAIKTDGINEKLIYYSAYLKHLGKKDEDHELTILGEKTFTYISTIYIDENTKDNESTKKIKEEITTHIETFKDDVDTKVDEFHNLIKS